jgi:polar amino acid transport system substrate-binding protein
MDKASELAPAGTLRVGLNLSNFLLVNRDGRGGEPRGVAPDLGRDIAARLGVPVAFVAYPSPGAMAEAAREGAWDIAFMAAEPARAGEIAFTAAYLEIEAGYLVPAGSRIRNLDEVDDAGVRIATYAQSAYDLYLSRTLRRATLVRAPSIDASFEMFVAERLEALSGLKPRLLMDLERLPGARILEGRFTAIQQAIGTPSARAAGAAFLRAYVEEAKRTGLIAELIARHRVQGVAAAPLSGES